MIDISIYSEKLDIALRQKSNSNYSIKIASELAKPEWQQQLFELDRIFSKVKDEQDFLKYQNTLTKLFDDIYEVITAPGVDDFIAWINEITNDKNYANAKKLRDFLVERYAKDTISESIEIINTCKLVMDIENSIFTSLLGEVSKELKKETSSLLTEPKQFENNIDDYLDSITSILEGLKEMSELYFTLSEQLYTDEQKAGKIAYYENIIKVIIEKGQSLKPQNDVEKSQETMIKVRNRIAEIKKGISILYNSKIALSEDETLKNIFLKLDKEIKYDKGISSSLTQFIDEAWSEVESDYHSIKEFFRISTDITYNTNWDIFAKKGAIISIVDDYNKIAKDNILTNILNRSAEDTIKQLKSKAKAIEKYNEQENNLKEEIKVEFKGIILEFQAPSIRQLLESLSIDNQELAKVKKEIESNIEGLKAGITKLNGSKNIILFIKDDFTYVLNNLNDIRAGFEDFLKKSKMADHLKWLDTKLNGSAKGEIQAEDFNDSKLIKELLDKGLIKIEIQKTFL